MRSARSWPGARVPVAGLPGLRAAVGESTPLSGGDSASHSPVSFLSELNGVIPEPSAAV